MADIYQLANQHRQRLLRGERAAASRMVRAYGQAYQRLRTKLDALTRKMAQAKAEGKEVDQVWLLQEQRYAELLAQLTRELGRFAKQAGTAITKQQLQFVDQAIKDTRELVAAATDGYPREVVASFSRLPKAAVENLVGALGDKSPLTTLLDQLPNEGRKVVEAGLLEGLTVGDSPAQMARRFKTALGSNLDRALRIARTESMRAYNEASRQSYAANSEIVKGWRWLCGLGPRTCAACLAMHGTFHANEERLDGHPNCRCTMVPDVKSPAELGFPGVADVRPEIETGASWLVRQPASVQETILGSKAARAAWASGEVRLEQFVGQRFSPQWGTMRYRLGLADARNNTNPPLGGRPVVVRVPDPLNDPNALLIWGKTPLHAGQQLNGIALKPAKPDYWESVNDVEIGEPAFDPRKQWSTGLVIVEPDGRLWMVEPKDHFGGYEHTFPKGKLEAGLSWQQNALKEAYEEAGLSAEIKGYLGDFAGTTSSTRYYIAKRTGGAPWEAHWESDKVKLVPLSQAAGLLNAQRDKDVLAALQKRLAAEPDILKKQLKPKPVSAFPANAATLKVVRKLGGSTGAELVEDEFGRKFVRKRGANADHLREEFLADEAYRALGVNVPKAKLYETPEGPVKLAEFIEGKALSALSGLTREKAENELRKHFAADALLGNWDVIGLSEDNVLVGQDGKVWRIDNGGSLRYRAMGALKTAAQWNEFPAELFSMRDAALNSSAGKLFEKVNIYEFGKQIAALEKHQAALLKVLPKEVRGVVEKRLEHLRDFGQIARDLEADHWKTGYAEGFVKQMLGLRQAGIVNRLPRELKQQPGMAYSLTDENGAHWDHLRGGKSIVFDLAEYIRQQGGDHKLMVRWAAEQGGDSWNGVPIALKYHLANQRNVPLDRYWWRRGEGDAKRYYDSKMTEQFMLTALIHHAFTYELLSKTRFRFNDKTKRQVRLIRTEARQVMDLYKLSPGQKKVIKRGAHESSSVFKDVYVFGNETTIQHVPYHRITYTYFLEGLPGSDMTPLLGDGENEFLFIPEGIELEYLGTYVSPDLTGGMP